MSRKRTTIDQYELRANYGYGEGWEVECVEMTWFDAKEQKKTYIENVPGINMKIVRVRVKIATLTAEELADYNEQVKKSLEKQAAKRLARIAARKVAA